MGEGLGKPPIPCGIRRPDDRWNDRSGIPHAGAWQTPSRTLRQRAREWGQGLCGHLSRVGDCVHAGVRQGERVMFGDYDQAEGASPTVQCPRGHVNSWNYKFCGQCGSPIGVVAWPEEEAVEETSRSRNRAKIVGIAVAVAAVLGIAAAAGIYVASPTDDQAKPQGGDFTSGKVSSVSAKPPCEVPPVVEAQSVDMRPEGLTVDAAFMTGCSGGDTESGTGVRVTVADGQRDIAAGLFDFASSPVTMEPGTVTRRTLVFPAGTFWRTAEMFSGAPQLVLHPGEDPEVVRASSVSSESLTAHAVANPEHGSVDEVAESVLAEIRDNDFGFISGSVANRWVPQISSKKAGLELNGKTWTSADVLRDHLGLRAKYPGARLLWSGQWTTFDSPDWWVTVVGLPAIAAGPANQWCDNKGVGADDCFAKFVSALFGVDGTTVHRK